MGLFSSLFGKKEPAPEQQQQQEPEPSAEAAPGVPLEELREALESPEGALRVDATRALLERWRGADLEAAKTLAERLPTLLDDEEPLVRLTALACVRMLRNPENLERCRSGVVACLADGAPQVRTAAVWAAVKLPGDEVREQVRAALQSEQETLRFSAACALSDVQDSSALAELTAALHDDHRRQEALSALMSLGDAAALPEIAKVFEDESLGEFDRTLVAAALARFGDARGGAYLAERLEEAGDDRPIAAEWAGRLGVQEAIPALEEVAQEEGDPARGTAMRALGRLRAPGAEERLVSVAGNAEFSDDLRMDAAEGLAELATPAALELLHKLAAQGEPPELKQLCQELLVEVAAAQQQPAPQGPGQG